MLIRSSVSSPLRRLAFLCTAVLSSTGVAAGANAVSARDQRTPETTTVPASQPSAPESQPAAPRSMGVSGAAKGPLAPEPGVDPSSVTPGVVQSQVVISGQREKNPGLESVPGVNASPNAPVHTSIGLSAKEGLYAQSSDGAFQLKVGAILQTRVTASTTPDASRKFEFVPVLARLYLQGTVGAPWLKFYLQPEFVGQQSPEPVAPIPPAPRLLDAWIEAQPSEWAGIRLGIMRPLFSRSWINGLQRALMFDRSDANLFFRTHGPIPEVSGSNVEPTLAWDRDIGAVLQGTPLDGVLEYSFGVYNGNGSWFGRNGDQWVMPMARLAVSPLGSMGYDETQAVSEPLAAWKFQVGVGAYQNRYRLDYLNPGLESDGVEEQRTIEADATMAGTGVYVSAEGYLRSRRLTTGESSEERGATALAGWMFWAPYLEVAARLSYIDPNRDVADDLRRVYEGQLNYYHFGNNLKLGLRYSWSNNQALVLGGVPGAPTMVAANTSISAVSIWTQLYF